LRNFLLYIAKIMFFGHTHTYVPISFLFHESWYALLFLRVQLISSFFSFFGPIITWELYIDKILSKNYR
jgi:hypothetical protein